MKRIVKKILFVVLATTLVLGIAGFSYFGNYYHASSDAMALIQETENVEQYKEYLAFIPEKYDTGIILYPGAKVESEAYAPLLKELSDRGIFAAVVYMPLHFAFLGSDIALDVMEEHPEIDKWYIAGHSLGGVAAGMLAEKHPEKFKGIILLASYVTSDLSKSGVKALSLIGSNDGIINMEQYEKNRKNLPADTIEVRIEGGNHAQFASYGFQKKDNEASITYEQQLEQTADHIMALIVE